MFKIPEKHVLVLFFRQKLTTPPLSELHVESMQKKHLKTSMSARTQHVHGDISCYSYRLYK